MCQKQNQNEMALPLWITALITTAIAVIVTFRWQQQRSRPINWPPGPPKLPIIGNIHQLSKGGGLIHVALSNLAQIHGRLMTIWMPSWKPWIVVSDKELIWEVLVNKSQDYAGRSPLFASNFHLAAGSQTLSTADAGLHWHNLRKGLQHGALSPLNVSSQAHLQESDLSHMIQSMLDEAHSNAGVVKPFHHIRRNTIRLLARFCFGSDFKDESFVRQMDELVEDAVSILAHTNVVDTFPIMRYMPGFNRPFKCAKELKFKMIELIRPRFSHPSSNTYLHFLLSQNFPETLTVFCLFELFLLGVDSTASTTMWALALLIHNPDIQDKLYNETNSIAGEAQRVVKVEEISKMKYLQAVVRETMRMKPIAPLAVTHKTLRETKLMGFMVPTGTRVLVNLYAMHHDLKIWSEPYSFYPERFLAPAWTNNNGSRGRPENSFLPFGGGMRICAGMDLAKIQIPLALANLVNAFRWSSAVPGQLPDLTEEMKFILMMKKPLEATISSRGI